MASQTSCVLRVSIHCEGCKRKVQKILQSIPGVHGIEIDRQYQRVVVTGDVSPESLVNKLLKSGKHAEIWPENPLQNHRRDTGKVAGKEEAAVTGKGIKPPASKTEVPVAQGGGVPAGSSGRKVKKGGGSSSRGDDGASGGDGDKVKEDGGKVSDDGGGSGGKVNESGDIVNDGVGRKINVGGGKVKEGGSGGKTEEKKPETGSAGDPSPAAAEKKEQQTENDGGGEGKKKKKKKKEGQNSNLNNTGESSSSAPAPAQATTRSVNQSPPRHHGYGYPAAYHYPMPPPVYTVSYNTAHPPVNSSYYAGAPPQYAYSHSLAPSLPSDYGSYAQQQPVDSFEMFSDENPNGCLVM